MKRHPVTTPRGLGAVRRGTAFTVGQAADDRAAAERWARRIRKLHDLTLDQWLARTVRKCERRVFPRHEIALRKVLGPPPWSWNDGRIDVVIQEDTVAGEALRAARSARMARAALTEAGGLPTGLERAIGLALSAQAALTAYGITRTHYTKIATSQNLKRRERMLTRAECEAAVSKEGTQAAAAEALGISARQLRRYLNGR